MVAFLWALRKKVRAKMAQNVEKVPKGSPKSSFFRAQSVIFGSQIRESGTLRKYHYLLCFNNIIAPKIDAGTQCAPETLFFPLLYALYALKCCPRSPQGHPKGPKGSPKASPGTPQNHEKIDLGAWEAPGVPSGRKMTQKSMKKRLILMYYIIYYILYTIY